MIHYLYQSLLFVVFPVSCYGCNEKTDLLCLTCRKQCPKSFDTPYQFIFPLYSFKNTIIRKMVHGIKYFHRKDLIEPFALELAALIKEESLTGSLVPIPMHPLRQLVRGYNHAEILAQKISVLTDLPYTPLLSRTFFVQQQVKTKNRTERMKSQYGGFKVTKKLLDEQYILIDDVTTTGATLLEARRVLLKHGASQVCAVTIAH